MTLKYLTLLWVNNTDTRTRTVLSSTLWTRTMLEYIATIANSAAKWERMVRD